MRRGSSSTAISFTPATVEVNRTNCAGYWLDAGELALIRAEKAESAKTEDAGKSTISGKVIRYLYGLEAASRRQR